MADSSNIANLATLGLVGFVVVKVTKMFDDPNEHHQEETEVIVEDEIDKAIAAGEQPTYSDVQYHQDADSLQAAMEGMGTDEEEIYGIIAAMHTKLDVLLLVKAFGIRWYKEFGPVGEDYTLGQWFQNELSDYGMDVVNNILAQRGIKFYF